MNIRAKFAVMVAVAAVGLVVVAGFWIHNQHSTLIEEKKAKTKNLVEVPYSLVMEQYQLESEGKISREQAQQNVIRAVRSMRYEESNYFWINDEHPTMIVHPMKPALDGKDVTSIMDPSGKAVFVEFVKAAQAAEGAYVFYLWPKPGKDKPVPKLSFVKRFAPWGWILGTGIYIDDVDVAWRNEALLAVGISLACLIPILTVSLTMSGSILRRIRQIVSILQEIAGKDLASANLEITSNDELGQAGIALNQVRDSLRSVIHSIASASHRVANASEELNSTSQQITANSEETSTQADVVSKAAHAVTHNLQTVATGAEEMSGSIKEIAKNATEAAKVATAAVLVAQRTTATVSKLGESSAEIGQVLKAITAIAQQTNLLALNATIEAARAGEAGKGFAVVANEVKELAKETAKATEDISRKIEAIQADTKAAVEAIASISGVIDQVNAISSTIATAVEEQNATTNEMSRNVNEAAQGSGEITSNIAGVAEAAASTSRGAGDTQKEAQQLVENSQELKRLVEQFKIGAEPDAESPAGLSRAAYASA